MLTVMCPNCRHQFAVPGCCSTATTTNRTSACNGVHSSDCHDYYGGGLLVPHGYTSNGGCFINAPTIIHGPAIIQGQTIQGQNGGIVFSSEQTNLGQNNSPSTRNSFPLVNLDQKHGMTTLRSSSEMGHNSRLHSSNVLVPSECQVSTTCDLTGGTVTITTPSIYSGGCLIQSSDSGILVQAPRIEIRPKLSGGGCVVQKQLSTEEDHDDGMNILSDDEDVIGAEMPTTVPSFLTKNNIEETNPQRGIFQNPHPMLFANSPLNGCRELPGTRRNFSPKILNDRDNDDNVHRTASHSNTLDTTVVNANLQDNTLSFNNYDVNASYPDAFPRFHQQRQQQQQHHHPSFSNVSPTSSCTENFNVCTSSVSANPSGAVIQVNATVQFPPNVGQCTVNITTTTTGSNIWAGRHRNNFNGGGLVHQSETTTSNERKDDAPTTPLSWVMPCPWGFDFLNRNTLQLSEIRKLLRVCAWYHEGLSWQQSECLLKDVPIGRWLLRDSSDSRYTFAVSVQTTRGPTSVRVHYLLGRFRLDAEPGLALAMPLFDCPIKMLEYYVDYSKRMDEHREVWVDYSGELYSQIYLTKPLVRKVRSLSHLARLVVNNNKLSTDHLPPLIKNYLSEYPYSL